MRELPWCVVNGEHSSILKNIRLLLLLLVLFIHDVVVVVTVGIVVIRLMC